MVHRHSFILKSFILISIIFSVALFNGCGKLSPVGPEVDQNSQMEPFGSGQVELQWGKVYSFQFYDALYGWVDEGGGTMDFEGDGYEAEFIIPDGAVSNWERITCRADAYHTESGMVYVFNFGPDGLEFDESTTLRLEWAAITDFGGNQTGAAYDAAELRYWNPVTYQWDFQQVDESIEDGYVEFQIDHFSRYGIGGRTR